MTNTFQRLKSLILGKRPNASGDAEARWSSQGECPTWVCFLPDYEQSEALEGLEALTRQLSSPANLFVFTGSSVAKAAIQRLDAVLHSFSRNKGCCGQRFSFGEQKEALRRRWGEGFSKIVELDEDAEAREECEGYLNEDILFPPLSLCLVPDVPHFVIFDLTWRFKTAPQDLYQELLNSDGVVRGDPLPADIVEPPKSLSAYGGEEWEEDEGPLPWEGLIFVNRAKLISLFEPLRKDLERRVETARTAQQTLSDGQAPKKKGADQHKQAKQAKISETILEQWQLDASQPPQEQVFAFLRAVSTASLGWHSLMIPVFRPRNFAKAEMDWEFFEALAALSASRLTEK